MSVNPEVEDAVHKLSELIEGRGKDGSQSG